MLGPEPVAGRASHFCVRATRGEIAAWEVRSSHPPTLGCGFLFAEGDHLIECLLYARRVLACLEDPGLIPAGLVRTSVECGTQALTPPPLISPTGCTAPRAALIGRSRRERFFLAEEQRDQEPQASPRGLHGADTRPACPSWSLPQRPPSLIPISGLPLIASGRPHHSRGPQRLQQPRQREGRNSQAQLPFQAVAAGLRVKELGPARKLLGTPGGNAEPAWTGPLEEQRPGRGVGVRHRK